MRELADRRQNAPDRSFGLGLLGTWMGMVMAGVLLKMVLRPTLNIKYELVVPNVLNV